MSCMRLRGRGGRFMGSVDRVWLCIEREGEVGLLALLAKVEGGKQAVRHGNEWMDGWLDCFGGDTGV